MQLTDSLNDQLMAMAAHRYCLPRQSYIVGCCLEWLRDTWPQFTQNTQRVMVRDTIEALMDDQAGDQCDQAGWRRFGNWAFPQLDEAAQNWVTEAVAWKKRPWPLKKPANPNCLTNQG